MSETGDGRRETGDERQETGDGRRETGDNNNGAPIDGVSRRTALKVLGAAVSLPILENFSARDAEAQAKTAAAPAAAAAQPVRLSSGPRGTASDPDLQRPKKDWPRKLNTTELTTLAALCDMIIPADDKSPSASKLGAPAYINEHVSAPYDGNARDLVRVRGGISWLNLESDKRFGKVFAKLTHEQKTAICDDICYTPKAKPEFVTGARFFSLVRNLTATAFYTTDEGMKDVGYVGNTAMLKWEPPPPAVLKQLGLS
jgi:gluconate 2-dehydrogenase gamma chain